MHKTFKPNVSAMGCIPPHQNTSQKRSTCELSSVAVLVTDDDQESLSLGKQKHACRKVAVYVEVFCPLPLNEDFSCSGVVVPRQLCWFCFSYKLL